MIHAGVVLFVVQILLAKISTSAEIQWRMGIVDTLFRWPNAIVPYVIYPHDFNSYQQDIIMQGMKEIESKTCIRFVPHTQERNYIVVHKDPNYCSSFIGMLNQGPQAVLFQNDCMIPGTVMHELMHALGLVHMHISADRDNYVDIDYSMIHPSAINNFQKVDANLYSYFSTGYDVDSVMHYHPGAFSLYPNVPTIRAKRPGDALRMGNRAYLSNGDIDRMNNMYCHKY